MKATLYFLVEVIESYNNYVELDNGLKVMVNNTIDSVEHINRVGKIISSPKGTRASEGDMILFHHNICREAIGPRGVKSPSSFQIKPNLYFIPASEIFMMKKADSERWEAIDPYVFIEPIKAEVEVLSNGLKVVKNDYNEMNESRGVVAFVNKQLEAEGLVEGDIVSFEEFSQHEYEINGKLYYKMHTRDILGVY